MGFLKKLFGIKEGDKITEAEAEALLKETNRNNLIVYLDTKVRAQDELIGILLEALQRAKVDVSLGDEFKYNYDPQGRYTGMELGKYAKFVVEKRKNAKTFKVGIPNELCYKELKSRINPDYDGGKEGKVR